MMYINTQNFISAMVVKLRIVYQLNKRGRVTLKEIEKLVGIINDSKLSDCEGIDIHDEIKIKRVNRNDPVVKGWNVALDVKPFSTYNAMKQYILERGV